MDITDKHDLILTQTQCLGGINYAVSEADAFASLGATEFLGRIPSSEKKPVTVPWVGPLLVPKKGEILFQFPGNTEKDEDMKPSFDVAFGNIEVFVGKRVLPSLWELVGLVQGAIDSFR
jgi:hypothetical protein